MEDCKKRAQGSRPDAMRFALCAMLFGLCGGFLSELVVRRFAPCAMRFAVPQSACVRGKKIYKILNRGHTRTGADEDDNYLAILARY